MQYFFILGKNPLLSKAELEAVLDLQVIKYKVIKLYDKVLILETAEKLDIDWLNTRLGGTVKIGQILGKIAKLADFTEVFFQHIKSGDGKVFFGFSLYALTTVHLNKYHQQLTPVAMEIKRILREHKNINSRYVVSREIELSSVIVKKNKLLQNGADICFFIKDSEILFGQTLAVQQFEEFGARDYSRPGRDDVSGMLPPKLARIMINLGQLPTDATILDPFCGSGTILQEALVLGYKKLLGSDNSEKAVKDTKENLVWLLDNNSLKVASPKVEKLDVNKLSLKIKVNSIQAIITEPYLGPALKGNENIARITSTISELEMLYFAAFEQFARILVKGGKVIMVFPIFNVFNSQAKLNIFANLEKLGFHKINKEELLYFREKQFVWRQINIFIKK